MNKQDEERLRKIAREEALKCIQEENTHFIPMMPLFKDVKKKKPLKHKELDSQSPRIFTGFIDKFANYSKRFIRCICSCRRGSSVNI